MVTYPWVENLQSLQEKNQKSFKLYWRSLDSAEMSWKLGLENGIEKERESMHGLKNRKKASL